MNSYEEDLRLSHRIAGEVAAAGGRAYYVGGCVRDALTGTPCKDIDIEIYAILPAALREVLSGIGSVYDKGASFGVLGLRGSNIDIAMPRTESRTGSRHTDFDVSVNPFLSEKEACRRRDFTINAMLRDVLSGEILDFFGGQADLAARVLRAVDERSFGEDALRAFRAAQFAARMNARIDADTLKLCAQMDVTALSVERVFAELEKALVKAEKPSVFFECLREMNHLHEYFPEIAAMIGVPQNPRFHPEGDVYVHSMLVLDSAAALRSRAQWPLGFMLSALMHDLGKCVATQTQADGRITAYGHEVLGLEIVERQLRRLTNHEKLIQYVLNQTELHMRPNMLAAAHSKKSKTRQMFDMSACPEDLILLSRADASGKTDAPYNEENERFLLNRLADYRERLRLPMVGGEDLITAGLQPGPDFARMLARARHLHFCGMEKPAALRQVLAETRNNAGNHANNTGNMQE